MDDDTTLARVKLVVLGAVKFVKRTVRWYDMPWPVTTRSTARRHGGGGGCVLVGGSMRQVKMPTTK